MSRLPLLLMTVFVNKWAGSAPTLTAPTAGAVLDDTTPDFSWSAVAGAATYDIEIRATLTGTPTATGIATNNYTPGSALPVGDLYWRVRAVNAGGGAGAWSAARTFVEGPNYYVATTGNDTTGDGTSAAPWKTIYKAISSIAAGGGANVLVDAGTYAENVGGSNYLLLTQTFADWVTVRQWHSTDAVLITDNGSGGYCVRYSGAQKIRFGAGVTIEQAGANTNATIDLAGASVIIDVSNCTITTRNIGIYAAPTTAYTITGTNTRIVPRAAGLTANVRALYFAPGSAGSIAATFTNPTFEGQSTTITVATVEVTKTHASGNTVLNLIGGAVSGVANYACSVQGCTLNLSGGVIIESVSAPALVFGGDGSATYASTGDVSNATINSTSSHAMIIGWLSDGVTVGSGVTVNGGDYGIVLKECVNADVNGAVANGGTQAAIYLKAATNTTVRNCQLTGDAGSVVLVGYNVTTGHKVQNITLTGNVITAVGGTKCLIWKDDTEDAGGGICDSNEYHFQSGVGNVGDVRATANITSLAALQAAWSGYGDGSNDANSTVIAA